MAGFDLDRSRAGWWAFGAVLAATLLFVLYSFVGTFVFGVFIYYATRPLYHRLRRYVRPPSLAAAVSLFLLALPALVLLGYAIAIGLQELERFADTADLGPFRDLVQPYLDVSETVQDPASLLRNPDFRPALQRLTEGTLASLGFVGNALLHVFVMLTLAFYLLRDGARLSAWARHRFADDGGVLLAYASAVDADFQNVFAGNILNALLTAAIGAIVYSVLDFVSPAGLGIPYPALVGLLTGAASLVPVVGMKLVYVPVAAYLFAVPLMAGERALLWFPILFTVVSFVIVDVIPDLVLRPYVSGRNLHVGSVMLAYILGPILFGWYGIFLGPMILVFVVHFARIVLPELFGGEPIRPYAVDPSYLTDDPPPVPTDEPADDEAETGAPADEDASSG